MANTTYTPGLGNLPFGDQNANPEGSHYAQLSQFTAQETYLLEKARFKAIYDNAPQQFNALKLLFAGGMDNIETVNSTEFEFYEHSFGRSAIQALGTAAAIAPVVGASQTQTFNLTAASLTRISRDKIILYPDGSKGTIVNIAGNTVTVNSHTGFGLSQVFAGDVFAVQSTVVADGMDYFSDYSRLDTIQRHNYVQFFLRGERWTDVEIQKFKNLGTTNYMKIQKGQKMKQLRTDMFNCYWNGQRGEVQISGGYVAKTMGGIVPTMIGAGAANVPTTTPALKSTFEILAFSTNHKAEGATRMVYGTDEMLYEFAKAFKHPTLQYTPNDSIAKLNLKKLTLGSSDYVLVPCELFKERSCFEASWGRKIIVLDQESIEPVIMKGIPAVRMGQTDNLDKGSREDFTDWWVKSQLSMKFNNPNGSFIMQF